MKKIQTNTKFNQITPKKIVSLILLFAMLATMLSGCTKTTESSNNTDNPDAAAQASSAGTNAGSQDNQSASDEPVAMGRYVEKVTDMSDKINGLVGNGIFRLNDGTLIITEGSSSPFWISKDNGETWEADDWAWHKKMMDDKTYISETAIGGDGTVAVIYGVSDDNDDYEQFLLIMKPDGTEIPVETPAEAGHYPRHAVVTAAGRVFVSFLGGDNLYEAKEDGSCELFLTMSEGPQLMNVCGNLLVMDGYDYKAPLIYDIEKEEYIEDKVLEDFMSENYEKGNNFGSDWYELYPFIGEENVIYIAGQKGLHRHVIGGSAVEEVIDGNLCTFSNPAYGIGSVIMLPDDEFMAIFSSGRLVHFVYDPDMPTVPSERLKVYSLKENDTIRQAISLYQTANPEVYVEYEMGMGNDSSVTRDDALKSLNTKIMAGEGPDVLILDNMPLDSYIEKGLLLDISPLIDSLSGDEELFGNIVEAMKTGDKLYAMPCEIQVPVIMSEDKYLSKAKDLAGLADIIEELREDNPGSDLFHILSERGILRFFSMTSVPAWTKENGEIDKEAVTEYLKQTKRIYDAHMDGLPEKLVENYNRTNEYWLSEMGELYDESDYLRISANELQYAAGNIKLLMSALSDRNGYFSLTSVNKVDGFEDRVWALMDGQCQNVFCANTLMGINAASQYTEQAQDFIKLCLGRENQSTLFKGLAVNKAAFDDSFKEDKSLVSEDGAYLWQSSSSEDGIRLDFITYWADEQQTAEFKSCIESLSTAYIEDIMLEDAVYEEGIAYFRGEKSLVDAVNAIEKKVSLYLAE